MMLCRIGLVADIFATGCRPLTRTKMKAITAANASSNSVLFRNLRSIILFDLSSASRKRAKLLASATRLGASFWDKLAGGFFLVAVALLT
jgi:hypothetical protein